MILRPVAKSTGERRKIFEIFFNAVPVTSELDGKHGANGDAANTPTNLPHIGRRSGMRFLRCREGRIQ